MARVSWELETFDVRKSVAERFSIEEYLENKGVDVESASSGGLDRRCKCPNQNHKNGNEKTPSFYFSSETNEYKCFGCNIYGDYFDLRSLIEGTPASIIFSEEMQNKSFDIDEIKVEVMANKRLAEKIAFEESIKIGNEIKEIIEIYLYTDKYSELDAWADSIYKRVDALMNDIKSFSAQEIKMFFLQLDLEVQRKKSFI